MLMTLPRGDLCYVLLTSLGEVKWPARGTETGTGSAEVPLGSRRAGSLAVEHQGYSGHCPGYSQGAYGHGGPAGGLPGTKMVLKEYANITKYVV